MQPDSRISEADAGNDVTPTGWMFLRTMSSSQKETNGGIGNKMNDGVTRVQSINSEDGGPIEEVRSDEELLGGQHNRDRDFEPAGTNDNTIGDGSIVYKVYKRRFFGLFQLALLNIIVSWDVCVVVVSAVLENYLLTSVCSGSRFLLLQQLFLNSSRSQKLLLIGSRRLFCYLLLLLLHWSSSLFITAALVPLSSSRPSSFSWETGSAMADRASLIKGILA